MRPFMVLKVLCGVLLLVHSASAQLLTYELLPGATITPNSGPTEALTGTLQWQAVPYPLFNEELFEPVSLNFSSASVSLSLYNGTQINSAAGYNSSGFGFSINVNATGLSISSGNILEYPNDGTYTGSPYAPTQINLPDLKISPIGGGLYAASLSFTAVLVPEPSVPGLVGVASILMFVSAVRNKRKRGRQNVLLGENH